MNFEEHYHRLLNSADAAIEAAKEQTHYRHTRLATNLALQAYELALENNDPQKELECAQKYELGKPKLDRAKSILED